MQCVGFLVSGRGANLQALLEAHQTRDLLLRISSRIADELQRIHRVVYEVTTKPSGNIK
jgi:GMP synthase PP-ATPase subunit